MNLRENKGITLIALVITIIVLLILAGVSLNLIAGSDGILGKASTAVDKTKRASSKEELELAISEVKMNYYETMSGSLRDYMIDNLDGYKTQNGNITCDIDGNIVYTSKDTTLTGTIDENGEFHYTGHVPVLENINITLKDGQAIPEDGAVDGTELKIEFTASIEGGTITSISPELPYVTNGTEKEVKFTITGTVEGETFTAAKTINLKDKYEKTEFEATDIVKKPTKFYGAIVDNYQVKGTASDAVKDAVTTWRIFYAGKEPGGTEDNVYLIADDYIHYTAVPNGKEGTAITTHAPYRVSFNDVNNDYNGGKFIWENSLAKNWLGQYLNYTEDNGVTYPNREESTNINIKATAYLMDTNIWSEYAGEKAKYAIGGPTVEMFITSYEDTHPDKEMNCSMANAIGYTWENGAKLLSDYNKIYIKTDISKTLGMWLASPWHYYTDFMVDANCNSGLVRQRSLR